jgi:hypothetical protein
VMVQTFKLSPFGESGYLSLYRGQSLGATNDVELFGVTLGTMDWLSVHRCLCSFRSVPDPIGPVPDKSSFRTLAVASSAVQ